MNRYLMRPLMIAVCAATLPASVFANSPLLTRRLRPVQEARWSHAFPEIWLAQLSDSLQQLASKVSPAVVQIEVSGFGPAEGSDRKDVGLIVRQHATGAGVIVDADGYIMTNADVVEGADSRIGTGVIVVG
jgi:S1-C subfamily serine protease